MEGVLGKETHLAHTINTVSLRQNLVARCLKSVQVIYLVCVSPFTHKQESKQNAQIRSDYSTFLFIGSRRTVLCLITLFAYFRELNSSNSDQAVHIHSLLVSSCPSQGAYSILIPIYKLATTAAYQVLTFVCVIHPLARKKNTLQLVPVSHLVQQGVPNIVSHCFAAVTWCCISVRMAWYITMISYHISSRMA